MGDGVSMRELLEAADAAILRELSTYVKAHRETHESDARSITIATAEMNLWKTAHNEWQKQMAAERSTYITRLEMAALNRKIESVERLVYIGIGAAMVLQIGLGVILAFVRR